MNGELLLIFYLLLLIVCAAVGAIFGKILGTGSAQPRRFLLGGLLLGAFLLFPVALLVLGF